MVEFKKVMDTPKQVFADGAGGWWFWDETWTVKFGPYPSEDVAMRELHSYCEKYLS